MPNIPDWLLPYANAIGGVIIAALAVASGAYILLLLVQP